MSLQQSVNTGINVYNAIRIAQMNSQMAALARSETERQAAVKNVEQIRQTVFEFNKILANAERELESNSLNLLFKSERILLSLYSFSEATLPEITDKEYLHRTRELASNVRDHAHRLNAQEQSEMVRRFAFLQHIKPFLLEYANWTKIIDLTSSRAILFFPKRLGFPHFAFWAFIGYVGGMIILSIVMRTVSGGLLFLALLTAIVGTPLLLGRLRRNTTKECHKLAAITGGYVTKYFLPHEAQTIRDQAKSFLSAAGYEVKGKSAYDLEKELKNVDEEIKNLDQHIQPLLPNSQ